MTENSLWEFQTFPVSAKDTILVKIYDFFIPNSAEFQLSAWNSLHTVDDTESIKRITRTDRLNEPKQVHFYLKMELDYVAEALDTLWINRRRAKSGKPRIIELSEPLGLDSSLF